jgi:hypothetical protein
MRVRIISQELIEVGRRRIGNGVAVFPWIDTETVQDDKNHGLHWSKPFLPGDGIRIPARIKRGSVS